MWIVLGQVLELWCADKLCRNLVFKVSDTRIWICNNARSIKKRILYNILCITDLKIMFLFTRRKKTCLQFTKVNFKDHSSNWKKTLKNFNISSDQRGNIMSSFKSVHCPYPFYRMWPCIIAFFNNVLYWLLQSGQIILIFFKIYC